MAQLNALKQFLDEYLLTSEFEDECLNGLQIESSNHEIGLIACAVDPGIDVINRAVDAGAGMLIVHHGLFWRSGSTNLVGAPARKVEALLLGRCSLYAAHLPLDAHSIVGNNAELARIIGARCCGTFCKVGPKDIGIIAELNTAVSRNELSKRYTEALPEVSNSPRYPLLLPFGSDRIQLIGIVSGSGSSALSECNQLGLDALISGEPKHEAYQLAKDLSMNAMFFGHYATETLGVKAISKLLEKEFGVSSLFIADDSCI